MTWYGFFGGLILLVFAIWIILFIISIGTDNFTLGASSSVAAIGLVFAISAISLNTYNDMLDISRYETEAKYDLVEYNEKTYYITEDNELHNVEIKGDFVYYTNDNSYVEIKTYNHGPIKETREVIYLKADNIKEI